MFMEHNYVFAKFQLDRIQHLTILEPKRAYDVYNPRVWADSWWNCIYNIVCIKENLQKDMGVENINNTDVIGFKRRDS